MNSPKYKLSYYLTLVSHNDEYLIAHGVCGKFLRMKKTLFDEARRNLNVAGSPEVEEAKQRLIKAWVIIPESADELEWIKRCYASGVESFKRVCALIIMLTLRCNFGCDYCYENEDQMDITEEILDRALAHLSNHIMVNKLSRMEITFSGGEPLLLPDKIIYTVKKSRKFCKENNLKNIFIIITNGSIFNPEVARLFAAGKDLSVVQITLDGPREVHDQRRAYKGGRGSYDSIMQNIPRWLEISKWIYIRINIDQDNVSHIPELFQELSGWKGKNIVICPLLVTEGLGRGEKRNKSLDVKVYEDWLDKYEALAKKIGLRMEKPPLPEYRPYKCAASVPHPSWLGPDGEWYCCDSELGVKSRCIGNVFTGLDEKKCEWWRKYRVMHIEECLKCRHIFFCGGPCASRYFRGITIPYLCGENFRRILEKNIDEIYSSLISQQKNTATQNS